MYLIKQRIREYLFVNFALYKYLIIIVIIIKVKTEAMYNVDQKKQEKIKLNLCISKINKGVEN